MKNKKSFWTGQKIALITAIVLIVLIVVGVNLLPALQTVGASFGYGYPSGKGGRAIRDVEIDVEPQVVYRIDDHRFFTFEKYLDCNSGGFVYYNDTKRGIKKFAGIEGRDKKPQNEVSINQKNDVLSFSGRFVYAASDDIIAYPSRNVNYKYGDSTYFVVSEKAQHWPEVFFSERILSDDIVYVTDDFIFVWGGPSKKYVKKFATFDEGRSNVELVDALEFNVKRISRDESFHCDNNIKPRSVKYIKN